MVKKKSAGRKKTAGKKKSAKRSPPRAQAAKARKRTVIKKKPVSTSKGKSKRKSLGKGRIASKGRRIASRKVAKRREPAGRATTSRRTRTVAEYELEAPPETRGLGPEAGGQAGDTEGLSRAELADSESVEELLEEGQAFEAGVVSGVENAPEAGESKGGVRTRQVPQDDVPLEYDEED